MSYFECVECQRMIYDEPGICVGFDYDGYETFYDYICTMCAKIINEENYQRERQAEEDGRDGNVSGNKA